MQRNSPLELQTNFHSLSGNPPLSRGFVFPNYPTTLWFRLPLPLPLSITSLFVGNISSLSLLLYTGLMAVYLFCNYFPLYYHCFSAFHHSTSNRIYVFTFHFSTTPRLLLDAMRCNFPNLADKPCGWWMGRRIRRIARRYNISIIFTWITHTLQVDIIQFGNFLALFLLTTDFGVFDSSSAAAREGIHWQTNEIYIFRLWVHSFQQQGDG